MNRLQRQRKVVIVWAISILLAMGGTVLAITMTTPTGGIIGSLPSNLTVGSSTPMMMILLMWTPILTAILWTVWGMFNHRQSKQDAQHQQETISPQNAPLPYKMALLLEMMDEDEREALKQDLRRQILADENNSEMFSRLMIEETEKRKRG